MSGLVNGHKSCPKKCNFDFIKGLIWEIWVKKEDYFDEMYLSDFRRVCTLQQSSKPSPVGFTTWPLFSLWRLQTLCVELLRTSQMFCMETGPALPFGRSCLSSQGEGPCWWGPPQGSSGSSAGARVPCGLTPKTSPMTLPVTEAWAPAAAGLSLTTQRCSRASWRTGTWCVTGSGWPSCASPPSWWGCWSELWCLETSLTGMNRIEFKL